MREERPDAKIIAISGGGRIGNTDFLRVAGKLGADATLRKPFDGEHLLSLVWSVLSGRRKFTSSPPQR
jgi:hypothetical protein